MRAGWVLGILVAFGALGSGCIVEVASRSAYETCSSGDSCGGTTSCQAAGFSASGVAGNLCTERCNSTLDCWESSSSLCVNSPSTRVSQCYRQCGFGCRLGTVCRSITDISGVSFNICVPNI